MAFLRFFFAVSIISLIFYICRGGDRGRDRRDGGGSGGGRDSSPRRRGNPPGRRTGYRLLIENLSSRLVTILQLYRGPPPPSLENIFFIFFLLLSNSPRFTRKKICHDFLPSKLQKYSEIFSNFHCVASSTTPHPHGEFFLLIFWII